MPESSQGRASLFSCWLTLPALLLRESPLPSLSVPTFSNLTTDPSTVSLQLLLSTPSAASTTQSHRVGLRSISSLPTYYQLFWVTKDPSLASIATAHFPIPKSCSPRINHDRDFRTRGFLHQIVILNSPGRSAAQLCRVLPFRCVVES